MLFKGLKAAAVIGLLTWMATNRDSLPYLPPASLGIPVHLGLPFASNGRTPNLADLPPAAIPGLIARVQEAVGNGTAPDLGPFTSVRPEVPVRAAVPRTLADRWREAPEETRRRIAALMAHRGARMLTGSTGGAGM